MRNGDADGTSAAATSTGSERTRWSSLQELGTLIGERLKPFQGTVDLSLDGDVFVLGGTVPDTGTRTRVARVLRSFAGVEKLRNEIQVVARLAPDTVDPMLLAHYVGIPQVLDQPRRRLRRGPSPSDRPARRIEVRRRPIATMREGSGDDGWTELLVDLIQPDDTGPEISLGTHPADRSELTITVRIACMDAEAIEDDAAEIVLHRDGRSEPAAFRLRFADGPGRAIRIDAAFFHGTRFCGSATLAVAGEAGVQRPEEPGESQKIEVRGLPGPTLSVLILAQGEAQRWIWTTAVPVRAPGVSAVVATGDAEAFARGLLRDCPDFDAETFEHRLASIGETLWDAAPDPFKAAYLELRMALGPDFAIQFVMEDAWIPWELMKPHGQGVDADHLGMTHPVARCPARQANGMAPVLPSGRIVSFAPTYGGTGDLPGARSEQEMLVREFGAEVADPTRRSLLGLLTAPSGSPVAVLHYAGHAEADAPDRTGGLAMGPDVVEIRDVDHSGTSLGERDHSLVVLNACEAGHATEQLGNVAGWAVAFARRGFGGTVAPLWAVDDDVAVDVIRRLLEGLADGRSLGEALRTARRDNRTRSATAYAYVATGDVRAARK